MPNRKKGQVKRISMIPYGGVSGEDRNLTGSATIVKVEYFNDRVVNVLVDIGMYQGKQEVELHNNKTFFSSDEIIKDSCECGKNNNLKPEDINVVIITHNHADHMGLLPRLVAEGFTGRIYTHINGIADWKPIFEDNLSIMETEIEKIVSYRKKLGKKLRIALKNINGDPKRQVSESVCKDTLEDTLIAYGFLQTHGISSKANIKNLEIKENKRIKNLKSRDETKNAKRVLKTLISDLTDALLLTQQQQKQSVLSMSDSEKILKKYNVECSADIDSKLPAVPDTMYSKSDIGLTISMTSGFKYKSTVQVLPGIFITAYNAAHLPWSSQIVLNIESHRILFSGDIGKIRSKNLLGDLDFPVENIDAAIVESTYGDREHSTTYDEDKDSFKNAYAKILSNDGNIMIPTFSNHRIQQVLHFIYSMIEDGDLPRDQVVYIFSGLGEKLHKNRVKVNPYSASRFLTHKNFNFVDNEFTFEKIVKKQGQVPIILASSGMVAGGAIMGLLKDFLPNNNNCIFTAGYMSEGTYGRQIFDRAKSIQYNGETISINSDVVSLGSFSGHAGREDLFFYHNNIKYKKDAIAIINHGDETSVKKFMSDFKQKQIANGIPCVKAEYNKEIEIYVSRKV